MRWSYALVIAATSRWKERLKKVAKQKVGKPE